MSKNLIYILLCFLSGHEQLVEKFSPLFHRNHHILIDLEYTLAQMYLKDVREATLEEKIRQASRKKEMCQHILQVLNMVLKIIYSS